MGSDNYPFYFKPNLNNMVNWIKKLFKISIKIRFQTFETNSSSTHTIIIPAIKWNYVNDYLITDDLIISANINDFVSPAERLGYLISIMHRLGMLHYLDAIHDKLKKINVNINIGKIIQNVNKINTLSEYDLCEDTKYLVWDLVGNDELFYNYLLSPITKKIEDYNTFDGYENYINKIHKKLSNVPNSNNKILYNTYKIFFD